MSALLCLVPLGCLLGSALLLAAALRHSAARADHHLQGDEP